MVSIYSLLGIPVDIRNNTVLRNQTIWLFLLGPRRLIIRRDDDNSPSVGLIKNKLP